MSSLLGPFSVAAPLFPILRCVRHRRYRQRAVSPGFYLWCPTPCLRTGEFYTSTESTRAWDWHGLVRCASGISREGGEGGGGGGGPTTVRPLLPSFLLPSFIPSVHSVVCSVLLSCHPGRVDRGPSVLWTCWDKTAACFFARPLSSGLHLLGSSARDVYPPRRMPEGALRLSACVI